MTRKELVYMILDELKLFSDDAMFNEDHIQFLIDKYRAFILKQRYADIKKQIPDVNFQSLCLDLIPVREFIGIPCGKTYLRSIEKVPDIMPLGTVKILTKVLFSGEITYVSPERFKYVGKNRFLKNTIYGTIGADNYLYLYSANPQFMQLESIVLYGIFQDSNAASKLECGCPTDEMDKEFPLESALVPPVIEMIKKELFPDIYNPADLQNNAKDDLHNLRGNGRRTQ